MAPHLCDCWANVVEFFRGTPLLLFSLFSFGWARPYIVDLSAAAATLRPELRSFEAEIYPKLAARGKRPALMVPFSSRDFPACA
jgi:hypothetical protein